MQQGGIFCGNNKKDSDLYEMSKNVYYGYPSSTLKSASEETGVNDCFVNSWADWSYFNAQNTFAVAETAAMIAPRALVVAVGDKDQLFDYKITEQECARIRPYYEIYDKGDAFKTVVFDGPHSVDGSNEEIEFLFKELEE